MSERFGNYEILRRIAAGGMAEVFLAKHRGIGGFERLVCIKRILPHLSEQEDFVKMFMDEARIAANLIHPHIAQIYDIGEVDGSYYIAMEYVRGEDLRRVYNQEVGRGRAMPSEPAAQIIMGAAAGLDYAHRQSTIDGKPLGIVHRDISPQNILVTYDGHVKVVDFGVAKAAGKMTETRTGVLKGKYSYMSPEQASGDPVDARTDIFALGITLYEVTTGTRLFKRDNEIETLHAVIECKVTPPAEVLPGYDVELESIVMRALKVDPDSRFATAGELASALEQMLIGRGHATGASTLGVYMQDLFAEKLADEILLGGQPAEDKHSSSKPRSGSRSKSSQSRSESRNQRTVAGTEPLRSASDQGALDAEGSHTEPTTPPESTQVDRPAAPPDAAPRAARSGSRSRPRDDWNAKSNDGTSAQTATRDAAMLAPQRSHRTQPTEYGQGKLRAERGAASTPPTARPRWMTWAGAAALIAVSAAVPIVVMSLSGPGGAGARSGELVVESEPRGARVVFTGAGGDELNRHYDGRGYRTPFTIAEGVPVAPGLKARFLKDGFEVVERELHGLKVGVTPEPLFAELRATADQGQGATLVIISTPPGADAYVDGNKVPGKTPVSDLRVRGGETHRVEVRLPGHSSASESLFVEAGTRRFIELRLTPVGRASTAAAPNARPGTLEAPRPPQPAPAGGGGERAAPSGMDDRAFLTITSPIKLKVLLDGHFIGDTPIRRVAVEPGMHKLKLDSDAEGVSVVRKVKLVAGRTEALDISPQKGSLALNATPWAWVRVGRLSPAETPVRLQVFEGEYDIQFECPDGRKKTETAQVSAGKTAAVTVNCRE